MEASGVTPRRALKFRHKTAPDAQSRFKQMKWQEGRSLRLVGRTSLLSLTGPSESEIASKTRSVKATDAAGVMNRLVTNIGGENVQAGVVKAVEGILKAFLIPITLAATIQALVKIKRMPLV